MKRQGSPVQVLLSYDGDKTAFMLDMEKQTWRARMRETKDIRSASLFRWPVAKPTVNQPPKVESTSRSGGEIAGQETTLHEIEANFLIDSAVEDASVRGSYRVNARIWAAESLPEPPLQRALRTG